MRRSESHWLGLLLVLVVGAATSCSGSNSGGRGGVGATTTPSASSGSAESIVIRTEVHLPSIRIGAGSTIGGRSFCPGGTAKDQHGESNIGLVDRTLTCPGGTLRIGFDPHPPVGNKQTGSWRVISGSGSYAGLRGGGQFVMTYDPGDHSAHPTHWRERFTGTVNAG